VGTAGAAASFIAGAIFALQPVVGAIGTRMEWLEPLLVCDFLKQMTHLSFELYALYLAAFLLFNTGSNCTPSISLPFCLFNTGASLAYISHVTST
jgi:hypothetical protein